MTDSNFSKMNWVKYSVKKAYRLLSANTMTVESNEWKWVGKLHCSQRIKSWFWKVFRGCVPTEFYLYTRGLVMTMRCPRCNEEAEDLQHLLLQCPWSMEIWLALEAECGTQEGSFQSNSWRKLLRKLSRSSNEESRTKLCFIVYTDWEIRKQRNLWTFNGEHRVASFKHR